MPEGLIPNPDLAFNSAGQDASLVAGTMSHVVYVVSGGTITAGQAVYFTYSSATGLMSATGATSAQAASAGGWALAAASTVGQIVPVALEGLFKVPGGTAVAAGAVFSVGASGWTAAASTVIGSNWGIAIQTQAAGGTLYWAQICRM